MFDRLGILCSIACAVHCALPLILSFLSPSLTAYFENEWIHFLMLTAIVPLALIAFLSAKKVHKKNLPLVMGTAGVFCLLLAIFSDSYFPNPDENFELYLTVIGSFILVLGHILNMQMISKARQSKTAMA